VLRPALVTAVVFVLAVWLDSTFNISTSTGLLGWVELALMGAISLVLTAPLVFFVGLSAPQRRRLYNRLRSLLSVPSAEQK
jgi:steroid 5-alpha reductase family enzyme